MVGDAPTDAYGGRILPIEGARVRTLDAFCTDAGIDRVDLVKMDVDGAEPEILRGAEHLLQQHRPTMIIELAPYALERSGGSLANYVALLESLEYQLFDQTAETSLPRDVATLAALIPRGGAINVIARPTAA